MTKPFVELHCHSNFSFLDGASHPHELAERAAELEMPALAITDTGGVYGAVRFMQAARRLGVRPLIGAELEIDGDPVRILARSKRGYSQLCRLLSHAHKEQPKGEARTDLATVSSSSPTPTATAAWRSSRAPWGETASSSSWSITCAPRTAG